MPGQTYNDGFPMDPLGAISAAYFLSEAEKQEWVDWIQTANEEQKQELVEILHSMWSENEKQNTQANPTAPATTPDYSASTGSYNPEPVVSPAPVTNQDPFTSTQIQANVIDNNSYTFNNQNPPEADISTPNSVSQPISNTTATDLSLEEEYQRELQQQAQASAQPAAPVNVAQPIVQEPVQQEIETVQALNQDTGEEFNMTPESPAPQEPVDVSVPEQIQNPVEDVIDSQPVTIQEDMPSVQTNFQPEIQANNYSNEVKIRPSQNFSMAEANQTLKNSAILEKYQEYQSLLQDPNATQGAISNVQNDLLALTMEVVAKISGLLEFSSNMLDLASELDRAIVRIKNRLDYLEQNTGILTNPASEEIEVIKMRMEVLSSKVEDLRSQNNTNTRPQYVQNTPPKTNKSLNDLISNKSSLDLRGRI